jgi:ribosome-binding protein aMBF1 (putative translation factor)
MSPGRRVIGSRKWFDTNYRTLCSKGYHICSKQYGVVSGASRCVAVKVNPRDVLSAPEGEHKIRVVTFESIRELGRKEENLFKEEGFTALENQLVVEVKKQRRELLELVLKNTKVKRHIKAGKLNATNVVKRNFGSLMNLARSYDIVVPDLEPENVTKTGTAMLRTAREQSGLTIGQIAKQMNRDYADIAKLERREAPPLEDRDAFIEAIAELTKTSRNRRDVSFKVENIEVKIPEAQ